MLNVSEKIRTSSSGVPLKIWSGEFVKPELYMAEDIKDYQENGSLIVPPWFKKIPATSASCYALIAFHNVGIDGILNRKGEMVIENFVKVHDGSGSAVMCWNRPEELLHSHKSYFQRSEDNELLLQDWVYRLVIAHSYYGGVPFVSEIKRRKFSRTRKEKSSLMDRINSLIPDVSPVPQPSYSSMLFH